MSITIGNRPIIDEAPIQLKATPIPIRLG